MNEERKYIVHFICTVAQRWKEILYHWCGLDPNPSYIERSFIFVYFLSWLRNKNIKIDSFNFFFATMHFNSEEDKSANYIFDFLKKKLQCFIGRK